MNRKFYVLTLLSALCCLLLFTLYPTYKLSDSFIQHTAQNERKTSSYFGLYNNKKKAFATIICDPSLFEATLVSVYSLKKAYTTNPSSKSDIVVLLPDSITLKSSNLEKLENLGVNIIRTLSPQGLIDDNSNSCDKAMINLWALFDYETIVYFTPSVIFENNVDHLFDYPAGSAVATNDLQSPLFIVNPNSKSFEFLLRESRKSSDVPFKQLLADFSYINYSSRLTTKQLSEIALVYTGPMKPWNFHSYSDVDWKKHYDPVSFYKWRRTSNELRHFFNPHTEWKNAARQNTVCDAYLESNVDATSFPITDQFSVMISTYNPERIKHLSLIIRHLLKSQLIHTVFVTWHNPALEVPPSIYNQIKPEDYKRVKILTQSFDSLNNRFNPTEELQTDAVYIMDDDIYIDIDDLEFTFSVWKSRKDSIVGHFPRVHSYDPVTQLGAYRLTGKAPYSIVLTKSMFIRSDYLFSFTCLLEPELHSTVDAQLNCEDLGFSMMASGLSGAAPTYVRTQKVMEDFGLKKGISTNTAHMPARAKCISDFITLYWDAKDPLIKAFDAVTQYERPQIRTGNWDRVEKEIMS